jgi:hypothetical protein
MTVKQMTVNTVVKKEGGENNSNQNNSGGGGSLSKTDKETIIAECLARVKEMIEYELKP